MTDRTNDGEDVGQYLRRIEAHLDRFAAGHDPRGHLFAIERLARAARAEVHRRLVASRPN